MRTIFDSKQRLILVNDSSYAVAGTSFVVFVEDNTVLKNGVDLSAISVDFSEESEERIEDLFGLVDAVTAIQNP